MIGIAVNGNAAHFAGIPDLTLHRKLEAHATRESDSHFSNRAKGQARVLIPSGCWRMRDGFPDENLLQQEMYRRVVRVQLALLAWRHGHGQFPHTLDALVGPYFDRLPLDPYCGRPFRYEPKGWPRDVHWIASNASLLSGLQYRAVGPAAQMAIVVPAGCPFLWSGAFLWSGGDVAGFSRSQSDEPPTTLVAGNVQVYSGYLFPLDPKITSPTSR